MTDRNTARENASPISGQRCGPSQGGRSQIESKASKRADANTLHITLSWLNRSPVERTPRPRSLDSVGAERKVRELGLTLVVKVRINGIYLTSTGEEDPPESTSRQ